MMSADNVVLYSGLPQNDWENKPKCPQILSNGPNFPKASGKAAKKTRTKTFLLVIFALCVVVLMLVLGFHIYETPKSDLLNFWGKIIGKPSYKHNGPLTTEATSVEVEPLNDKDEKLANSHHNEELDKETNGFQMTSHTTLQPTISITQKKDILPGNPQITDIPKAPETEPEVNSNPPTTSTTLRTTTTTTLTPKSTTVLSTSTVASLNNEENSVEADKKDVSHEAAKVTTSTPKQENYEESTLDKSNSTMNVTDLDKENIGSYNNDTWHLIKPGTSNDSITDMVVRITNEYFNKTILRENEVKQWFDQLIAKPSVEVILIAAAIIFVGLSLLIIGVTCIISKRSKLNGRRERIRTATDVDSNEKIVLLTDDVSEDEFVKA